MSDLNEEGRQVSYQSGQGWTLQGQVLRGKYEIQEQVGKGGMGEGLPEF